MPHLRRAEEDGGRQGPPPTLVSLGHGAGLAADLSFSAFHGCLTRQWLAPPLGSPAAGESLLSME